MYFLSRRGAALGVDQRHGYLIESLADEIDRSGAVPLEGDPSVIQHDTPDPELFLEQRQKIDAKLSLLDKNDVRSPATKMPILQRDE